MNPDRPESLGEQDIVIIRHPLIQWPDGMGQVCRGRFALLHRQQQPSEEQARVGAAFTAARAELLMGGNRGQTTVPPVGAFRGLLVVHLQSLGREHHRKSSTRGTELRGPPLFDN
jgi:hypothetical protein